MFRGLSFRLNSLDFAVFFKFNVIQHNIKLCLLKNMLKWIPCWLEYTFVLKRDKFLSLVLNLKKIFNFSLLFKNHIKYRFDSLLDIWVVDFPYRKRRFELNYNLISSKNCNRFFLKLHFDEYSSITSLVPLYNSADWLEREAWDMFGIFFVGHPDLRRILTDYGFIGHPLRKDFPLTGYVEVRYDDAKKRVVFDALELTQEFRFFSFKSPWRKLSSL